MHSVYLVAFLVGVLLTVVFFLSAGLALGHGHHGAARGHARFRGAGHTRGLSHQAASHGQGHGQGRAAKAGGQRTSGARPIAVDGRTVEALGLVLSVFSPVMWAGGLLLFGGVGLMLGSSRLALPSALAAGLLGLALLRMMMAVVEESATPPLTLSADGAVGTVNARVGPAQTGEVLYTLEGLARSMPARTASGVLDRGTEVVITHIEHGFAWVEPVDPLAGTERE